MDRRWFPAQSLRARRQARACGPARRSPPGPAAEAGAGDQHGVPDVQRSAPELHRAFARAGELRHAVLGVRHHRAQLSRHRAGGRCGARPGRRRSQHGAGRRRRREHHVRRHARGPGRGRVHPSAAQSRGRRLRPEAHRHDAGASPRSSRVRDLVAGRVASGSSGLARTARSARAAREIADIEPLQLPLSRTMRFRDSNVEGMQLVNPPLDFDGVLLEKSGRVVGAVVELRVRERARGRAGQSRRAHRPRRGDAGSRADRQAAAFAGSRSSSRCRFRSARDLGLSDEWVAEARAARALPSARCFPPCAWSAARRRRRCFRQGDLLLASTARWSPASARWSARWPTRTDVQGHRVARRGRSRPSTCATVGADGQRRRSHRASGRAPRCRRRIAR